MSKTTLDKMTSLRTQVRGHGSLIKTALELADHAAEPMPLLPLNKQLFDWADNK